MALMRRNTITKDGTPGSQVLVARPDDFNGFEHVWDFLTMRAWPDTHKVRQTGSVLLFSDDTGLKVRLQDNDCDQVAFALIDTEAGVWQSVEAMLTAVQTDWRPYVRPGGGRRK